MYLIFMLIFQFLTQIFQINIKINTYKIEKKTFK